MLQDLAARFVRDELMPLETAMLARDASGEGVVLAPAEKAGIGVARGEVSTKVGSGESQPW